MVDRIIRTKIEERLSKSPAVAILGPRQVGKTTLAKELARLCKRPSTYLDMENPRDQVKLTDAYTYLENLNSHCVIIDEVQLKPELFSLLRPLIDEDRVPGHHVKIISLVNFLLKELNRI